ncbi:hypothetical protein OGAPHI_004666 [Ogataea philodendri]|uniref:Uncharacterized protein n=1 Tax=Ogataea philodendri TaxID=1378263 RepID=A0A9P8P2F7_9ASCO|nr:uncharacterized protein OGAPHI_004666 [Ogataea philodendri]KAH3663952.1 hypothetical protein OGAPHI_004666 [Ogataea philodendri]
MLGKEKIDYSTNSTLPTSRKLETGLPGKVILITGANTGIGAAIAKGCLDAGAKSVYSLDLKEPSGTNEFVTVQAEYPGQAFYLNGDVTKIETLQKAFATVLEKEETIDGVVANAGVTIRKGALEYTPEEWDFIINVNLKGVVNTCNVAVDTFLSLRKPGSIVVTASMVSHGTNKSAPSLPYQATKSAILGVVRGFAAEFGPQGIRINCVSPGYIQTALTTYHLTDDMWDYKLGIWGGLHRLGEPRELAGTYVYFLSDASSFTSGVDIKVHGATDAW